jgi:hypothetical protein
VLARTGAPRRWSGFLLCCLLASCAAGLSAQTRRPYPATRYGGNYLHNYLIPPAPSATPWAPAWAPDGKRLAIALHGSIWIVSLPSGRARELTTGRTYHSAPAWSPDARWIVYTADDGGKTIELEAVDVATGAQHALTADKSTCLDPAFSPDGTRLAYTASKPDGFLNVFVRPFRDGQWSGDELQVTRDSVTKQAVERPYFTEQDMHITPRWIDDRTLVFVANHGVARGSGSIVRAPAEAGGIDRAETLVREQTLYLARPDVSPKAGLLVWASAKGGTQRAYQLLVRPLAGGETRPLTHGDFDWFVPRWSPDGRTLAALSNERGLPELALVDAKTGTVRRVPLLQLERRGPTATITVRVTDGAGGLVTAARVHSTASDGRFYAPDGAYARVSWASDRVFHTPGTFTLTVPAGALSLDIVKGFEHRPAHVALDLAAGETRTLDVPLERLDAPASRGWYSGSTGAHMHPGGLMRERVQNLVEMADAEGQRIVSDPLAHRDDRFFANGSLKPIPAPTTAAAAVSPLLALGQEHRPPFFGHLMAFGMSGRLDTLIPVTIGFEGPAAGPLFPSNADVLTRMRAAGGITSYVHAFGGEMDPLASGLGIGKSFMVDAALGIVDTLEWAAAGRGSFAPWYAALNNGLRVTAIGGEDSITNLHISRLVGAVRTYAWLGATPLSTDAWWKAIAQGRTFVTTGPLVELTVNGQGPGDDVKLDGAGTVDIVARVRSITPLQKVFLVAGGQTVAEIPLDAARQSADWRGSIPVSKSTWVHLRAEGAPSERFPLDALYAQAFTNPTWITVGGRPVRDAAAAEYGLKWIDLLQGMADVWPGWTSEEERRHVFGQFDEARRRYRQWRDEATVAMESSHE